MRVGLRTNLSGSGELRRALSVFIFCVVGFANLEFEAGGFAGLELDLEESSGFGLETEGKALTDFEIIGRESAFELVGTESAAFGIACLEDDEGFRFGVIRSFDAGRFSVITGDVISSSTSEH